MIKSKSWSKKLKPIDSKIYDKEYFLKYCCGATEFTGSNAEKLPKRLQRFIEVANFKKGQKILDIGCGRGEVAYHAVKKGCYVTAVDYATEAIKITKNLMSKLPNKTKKQVIMLRADAKDFKFPQQTFDKIIMADVIEHLQPWEAKIVVHKCRGFLKPEGKIIINTSPNVWFLKYAYPILRFFNIALKFNDPGPYLECYGEVHVFEQSPLTLKTLLTGYKTKIWGENFTKSVWLNKIPILNLFAASLFVIAEKND